VKTVVKRAIVMAISVILALAVAAPIASGQPANQGKDLKALTEAWWTWALAVPSPMQGDYSSPDPRCEGDFVDGVFFLAGTSPLVQTEGDATRTCTVPADTALFFPAINAFCTEDEDTYPQCARGPVNTALANGETFATLDGEDLKIRRLATGPFTLILPEPNIFGVPGGPYEHRAISDGLWVYLPQGLEPREDPYTLQFGGTSVDAFGEPFSVNVTYELTVV
jgi:hypothetical protein